MKLHRTISITAVLVIFAVTLQLSASSSMGVFATVARVVLEPNASAPERIQIWGTFIVPVPLSSGAYQEPRRGYLYFSVPPGKEDIARKEWADIQAVAGKNQTISFGEYWVRRPDGAHQSLEVDVRKESVRPSDPDIYPIGVGIVKLATPLDKLTKRQLSEAPVITFTGPPHSDRD